MDNTSFKRDVFKEVARQDPLEIQTNKDKVLEGQILETMMNSRGGLWLQKWFDHFINLNRVMEVRPEDRLKETIKMEGIILLRNTIAQAIETKNQLEGEVNE